jgi:transcriptional regulator with XRE-family HTH domain
MITKLTNEIVVLMREYGITRADLAGRMGVSPGRISQVLSGGENLTVRTLASLATALDAEFDVQLNSLKPRESVADADFDFDMPDFDDAPAGDHVPFRSADSLGEAGNPR